jgi:hypothetical protein
MTSSLWYVHRAILSLTASAMRVTMCVAFEPQHKKPCAIKEWQLQPHCLHTLTRRAGAHQQHCFHTRNQHTSACHVMLFAVHQLFRFNSVPRPSPIIRKKNIFTGMATPPPCRNNMMKWTLSVTVSGTEPSQKRRSLYQRRRLPLYFSGSSLPHQAFPAHSAIMCL